MTAYRIEVNVMGEWKPVGKLYRSKDVAKSWLTFVKRYWHAKSGRVVPVEVADDVGAQRGRANQ